MLLLLKIIFWYMIIGLLIVFSFRNQALIARDVIKNRMEEENGLKKSDAFWLNAVMVIFTLLWPRILYKAIRSMRGED